MRSLVIHVEGAVAAQGSKIAGRTKDGRNYVREASKNLKPWRDLVIARTKEALHKSPWHRDHSAVRVDVAFAIQRPQDHYVARDRSRELRPDAPLYCPTTPDVDKAARAILDALTQAEAIVDDARVVHLQATTLYAGPGVGAPGAVITVSPMPLRGQWSRVQTSPAAKPRRPYRCPACGDIPDGPTERTA